MRDIYYPAKHSGYFYRYFDSTLSILRKSKSVSINSKPLVRRNVLRIENVVE